MKSRTKWPKIFKSEPNILKVLGNISRPCHAAGLLQQQLITIISCKMLLLSIIAFTTNHLFDILAGEPAECTFRNWRHHLACNFHFIPFPPLVPKINSHSLHIPLHIALTRDLLVQKNHSWWKQCNDWKIENRYVHYCKQARKQQLSSEHRHTFRTSVLGVETSIRNVLPRMWYSM